MHAKHKVIMFRPWGILLISPSTHTSFNNNTRLKTQDSFQSRRLTRQRFGLFALPPITNNVLSFTAFGCLVRTRQKHLSSPSLILTHPKVNSHITTTTSTSRYAFSSPLLDFVSHCQVSISHIQHYLISTAAKETKDEPYANILPRPHCSG